ncbi:MAG: 3-deoxy-D-manno-octulosonic acid transferase [Pseudomonadota bacterium]
MTYILSAVSRCHYSILFVVFLPAITLRLFWRSIKVPDYRRRIAERFGVFSVPAKWLDSSSSDKSSTIVFHAVSVGETMAVLPVIKRLLIEQPSVRCVVTCSTPTGSTQIQQRLSQEIDAGRVFHVYLPYDVPMCVNAFLARIKPHVLVVVETELWPNLLSMCQRKGIKTALINARLSDKSCRAYSKISGIAGEMMGNLDKVLPQDAVSAERFRSLGVPSDRSEVTGNVKFDVPITPKMNMQATEFRARLLSSRNGSVLIAGSTHPGEDEIVFEAFRALMLQCEEAQCDDETQAPRLIIVPRHPERFDDVFEMALSLGFNASKYSQWMNDSLSHTLDERGDVLVVDEMGQLLTLYGVSDVALVCGSLLPSLGGHNLLEPAVWGVPVLSGKGVFNFQSMSDDMVAAGALSLVSNADELCRAWCAVLQDACHARQAGEAARRFVMDNQGAVERTVTVLNSLIFD